MLNKYSLSKNTNIIHKNPKYRYILVVGKGNPQNRLVSGQTRTVTGSIYVLLFLFFKRWAPATESQAAISYLSLPSQSKSWAHGSMSRSTREPNPQSFTRIQHRLSSSLPLTLCLTFSVIALWWASLGELVEMKKVILGQLLDATVFPQYILKPCIKSSYVSGKLTASYKKA